MFITNETLKKMYQETYNKFWFTLIALFVTANLTLSQCPWQHDIPDLQTSCVCAYNLGRELSVQCDQVDFSLLMEALNRYTENKSIDLLYVNNSTINKLTNHVFISLRLHNIQLSSCKIRQIDDTSFRGQETILRNLNLQDNLLENVPSKALSVLNVLNLLDLSKNRIKYISDGEFKKLSKLSTLKLNDNNVTLSPGAFRGIEKSLKNLNLKNTRQKKVPEAIRGLKALAFLDLSQNGIKELPNGFHTFEGLDSLTALNLERNLIQNLGETAFDGIKKTLSSLSLLNNLLAEFPIGAIHSLRTLKVLDIGFNLLTTIPEVAFRGNSNITLLALDGNPLSTVNEIALSHLNHSLRGISLGGRFLHCDCKLKWIAEWIQNTGLQVTSRERNPQFCGSPAHFRDRGFYSIQPAELNCPELDIDLNKPVGVVDSLIPKSNTSTVSRITSTTPRDATLSTLRPSIVTATQSTTFAQTQILPTSALTAMSAGVSIKTSTASVFTVTKSPAEFHQSSSISSVKTQPLWRQNISSHTQQRPPLVLGYPSQRGTKVNEANEVQVKNAFRQDNSVIIQWDSITANVLGFRVVYRLFGEKSFKQGPPLEASEREFKIKNVPSQECIIICVISLEELNVTPDTVSYSQCKEVRTVSSQTSNMDKITISASAAICGTIIVAVIVFIAASRRSRRMQSLKQRQKSPAPIVNCCGPSGIAKPFGSMANLSAFNNQKDWDQVSAYSGRSIPRPRIYSVDNQDDRRSHISHFSAVGKSTKTRSIADGQSQHSLSNNSQRGYLGATFSTDLVNSRPELRLSRQSLSATSERTSRASYVGSIHGPASITSSSRKSRPRSRNRNQLNGTHIHSHRLGNRYSTVASAHALNNYCDTSDNWTDHDMEIYITRNATTRNGLVPL